ncbi:MAG: acyl CoA:acetate/3-ketoacid CoA transferase, partial [Rhodobacteraceae bacterium]|nr:acyl CoA:acetate/3-ketoacid CoA transferase [Paracoccaceae bacterium]
TKMVQAVEHVTFSGRRARALGQDIMYITERCVMRLGEGGLVATEIMPGIDPARDIVAASEGRVRIAVNAVTMPKSLLTRGAMEWAQ